MRVSTGPKFSTESEKGTAAFVDGVHGPRKGRTLATRGLHVQDRSEINRSFTTVRANPEQRVSREIRLSVWPLFALSHHFVVWHCADKQGIPRKEV